MHTFEQLFVIIGIMCVLILPFVIGRRLMPAWQGHVIRPGLTAFYAGLMSVLVSVFAGLLGVIGDIFRREPGQQVSWALVVAGFLVSGVLTLVWSLALKVVVTGEGLEIHAPFRRVRRIAWRAIDTLRVRPNHGIAVMGSGRRLYTLSSLFGYCEVFFQECEARGIPLLP